LLSENRGALCVNALAHMLGVSQSEVPQHLRVLRQAGLVRGERYGSFVHYALDKGVLKEYKDRHLKTFGEDFAATR
jgi:DNA-binding transcriptional ArsR family regulator